MITLDDRTIDRRISMVKDTLKFQGVEITKTEFRYDPSSKNNLIVPKFYVKISKKKMSKDLDYVLTFTYWSLWVLVYGKKCDKNSNCEIDLLYDLVEDFSDDT